MLRTLNERPPTGSMVNGLVLECASSPNNSLADTNIHTNLFVVNIICATLWEWRNGGGGVCRLCLVRCGCVDRLNGLTPVCCRIQEGEHRARSGSPPTCGGDDVFLVPDNRLRRPTELLNDRDSAMVTCVFRGRPRCKHFCFDSRTGIPSIARGWPGPPGLSPVAARRKFSLP